MSRVLTGCFYDNISFKCKHKSKRKFYLETITTVSKLCLVPCERGPHNRPCASCKGRADNPDNCCGKWRARALLFFLSHVCHFCSSFLYAVAFIEPFAYTSNVLQCAVISWTGYFCLEDPICTLLRKAVMENALWSVDLGWLLAAHPAAPSLHSSAGLVGVGGRKEGGKLCGSRQGNHLPVITRGKQP